MTENKHLTLINKVANNNNCTITIYNNVIQLTGDNRETLWHLLWKDALTNQKDVQDFNQKIFKLYAKKPNHKISMATLRVIQFMDDDLLKAIIALYDIAFDAEQKGLRLSSATQQFTSNVPEDKYECYSDFLEIINLHQLRVNVTSPGSSGKYNPALDIYKMYKSQ